MGTIARRELALFNAEPITSVDYESDIDFVGDGIRHHRLDVISPRGHASALPVYIYFHGGGWTSGDKGALTKYCASQAAAGMVVVNVNYRPAIKFRMTHILDDADAAIGWVRDNIARFGGDPSRIVLGGDSAGGQIAALYCAMLANPELALHYSLAPALPPAALKGLVQHCSVSDFSVLFERDFVLGIGFVKMLLPHGGRGRSLRAAARYLSPIEWVAPGHPPVLITTSERDYLYQANLNFAARLRSVGANVETLIFDHSRRNTEHTWQQNAALPESQQVYERLQHFVFRVSGKQPASARERTR